MNKTTATLSYLFFHLLAYSHAEIRRFEGKIEASPKYIHYSEGFLVTPGYVDISKLVFTTVEGEPAPKTFVSNAVTTGVDDESITGDDGTYDDFSGVKANGDDDFVASDDGKDYYYNDTGDKDDDKDDIESKSHSGNDRRLYEQYNVEVVLFHEPKNCTVDSKGMCDWSQLGVGATDKAGDLRWCCWEDAVDLGLCTGNNNEYGKLIVNKNNFNGVYRSLQIPPTGEKEITFGKFGNLKVTGETGRYAMVMSNCNPLGRNLTVTGKYVWMSDHGYLPGDLFGEMYFNMGMSGLYLVIFLWYLLMMKLHKDSAFPIQNYILLTIGIGFFEVFFKAGDYWVWNEDGTRFPFAMYSGLLIGVFKRAISRCLVVMVSLGWGVVRDDLRDHMRNIYLLGGLYVVTSLACDVLKIFRVVENEVIGSSVDRKLLDITAVLTFVVAAIDVTFYMWILDSLSGTMQYLENMSQATKLQRYLRLRLVLLLSILFAVVWAVFGIVNNYLASTMLDQGIEWGVQAAWEVNYFLVLTSVSCLWKPDHTAKEYAYVMELPSMPNDDMEFATNADCDEEDDVEDDAGLKIGDGVGA